MKDNTSYISVNVAKANDELTKAISGREEFADQQRIVIHGAIAARRAELQLIQEKRGFIRRLCLEDKFLPSDAEISKELDSINSIEALESRISFPREWNETQWWQYNTTEIRDAIREYLRGTTWVKKIYDLQDTIRDEQDDTMLQLDVNLYNQIKEWQEEV